MPFVRGRIMALAYKKGLQHDASDGDCGGRQIKREERLRFIQKTQMDTPVGEMDRSLQVLGYILRQKRCGHRERLFIVWTILNWPVA